MKNCVISFALWGDDPKYVNGFVENCKIVERVYPGWKVFLHLCDTQYPDEITCLADEVINHGSAFCQAGYSRLMTRLTTCGNDHYDYVIVRDTDSRINMREAEAVKEWIESGYTFHIMRDHPHHGAVVMGGMFGCCPAWTKEYFRYDELRRWSETYGSKDTPLGSNWGTDQQYLKEYVWPNIRENHIAHDDWKRVTHTEFKFKRSLGVNFVGQRFDANNKPEFE